MLLKAWCCCCKWVYDILHFNRSFSLGNEIKSGYWSSSETVYGMDCNPPQWCQPSAPLLSCVTSEDQFSILWVEPEIGVKQLNILQSVHSHCCKVNGSRASQQYWFFLSFTRDKLWTTRAGRHHLFLSSLHQQWRLKSLPMWRFYLYMRIKKIKDVLVGLCSAHQQHFLLKAFTVTFQIQDER